MSQSGEQTNVIHILPNISQSEDNHTTNLGQLIIEYNKRNISLWNLYRLVADPSLFLKKFNMS